MNNELEEIAMKVFRTTDGYTLKYDDGMWTDGDLQFVDVNGVPVSEMDGEPVEGELVDEDGSA